MTLDGIPERLTAVTEITDRRFAASEARGSVRRRVAAVSSDESSEGDDDPDDKHLLDDLA